MEFWDIMESGTIVFFWAVMGSGMMFLGCHGVSNDGVLAHCSEVFGCCLDGVFGAGVGYYEGR